MQRYRRPGRLHIAVVPLAVVAIIAWACMAVSSAAAAAAPAPSAPNAAQVAGAQAAVVQQSGNKTLQLHAVDSQTYPDGITQTDYVALPPGVTAGGTVAQLAESWNATVIGPSGGNAGLIVEAPAPPPLASTLAPDGQVHTQQTPPIAAKTWLLHPDGTRTNGLSQTITKQWMFKTPPATTSRVTKRPRKGSHAARLDISYSLGDLDCVGWNNSPELNYLFGYGVAVASFTLDCDFPGTTLYDIQGWEYPKGPAMDHSGGGTMGPSPYGYYISGEVSAFCSIGFPTGWWTNLRILTYWFDELLFSTVPGGDNSPAVTLNCYV